MIAVVPGGEQSGNEGISDAVKRTIDALVQCNKDEPVQRLAEIATFKEVSLMPYVAYDDNNYKSCNN